MELFYAYEVSGRCCRMDAEESGHCVRVLRHRVGDEIDVIDGLGTLYHCRLTDDNPKCAEAEVLEIQADWNAHPYHLTIGCCPTKNNDRFEWFVEKATEVGVDCIVPLIGERSERKVYKTDRARRIALSAAKQSLKARIPVISEPLSVKDFILRKEGREGLCVIAYCFEGDTRRLSIKEALRKIPGQAGNDATEAAGQGTVAAGQGTVASGKEEAGCCITVLIGPEGDFSPEEAQLALGEGFIPVHLGASRLRTETAAVTAAEAVYLHFME